ncbi:polysaccharide pyruvyl transferase family protein [Chelativorans sp. AA-79]|uniref:polysaccharide pyruvyl transferase family protein n=1 Tax=Chelativorans sp. AA-79 TaxID=3028735 RepID=UPI0023F957AD|nr:polysaccharide pyruvyl transferase family protein [Chelativorans sp. AA-79]WEX10491.1 polysaccharide pyruvyl transferase family protein [Chelativorans sp. AA-79]
MKILIFNVKYSPNLGDGVLAACLEHGLMREGRDVTVETIDIAGREEYRFQGPGRMRALSLLRLLPAPLRAAAVTFVLRSRLRDMKAHWLKRIEEADAVVVGGGNLFQDDDLNFPLKLNAVLEGVDLAGKPLAVFAVGVTAHWSARARRLFARLLDCPVVHVSVRDGHARENWIAHFGNRFEVEVTPDPGLLARNLPSGPALPYVGPPVVGLGVTHPLVLRRHAGIPDAQIPLSSAAEHRLLVRWLVDAGCRVMLFTNGADEDERFMRQVVAGSVCEDCVQAGSVVLAERPSTPDDLVATIGRSAVVIAHRLHASIVAYSLGIPCVGLGWDQKVKSFYEETGRADFFLRGKDVKPADVGAHALRALEAGIASGDHARQLKRAETGLVRLTERLRSATGQYLPGRARI